MCIPWPAVVLMSLAVSIHAASIPISSTLASAGLPLVEHSDRPQLDPVPDKESPIISITEISEARKENRLEKSRNDEKILNETTKKDEKLLEISVREEKLLKTLAREAKLLNKNVGSSRTVHRTLDRGASELAWKNWLQSPESKDPAAPPRRITPKSVFIAPHNCPEGKRLSGEGCISVHTVGKEAHDQYILDHLNNMNEPGGAGGVLYDYDEEPPTINSAEEPLQLNLPLGPSLTAPASQSSPSLLSINLNKKDDDKRVEAAELEAELEKLKQEIEKIASNKIHRPIAHSVLNDYPKLTQEKPKRDNNKVDLSIPEMQNDQGQKEVIFGNVSEDTYQYTVQNITHQNIREATVEAQQTDGPTEPTTQSDKQTTDTEATTEQASTLPPTQTDTAETATEMTTVQQHNLKEDEKPTQLHPEIDYSDIGDTIKLISRYAEVTTDDSFNNQHKKHTEDGPLGTRTKQQHRKKQQRPVSPAAGLYAPPPPPPPSVYTDRVPARLVYPRPPGVDYYRYPTPPADFPFRHVQEYWPHDATLPGPYAHNPRRHHHSYLQPPHRARRPPTPPNLYRLLGLQHWLNGDGAAER